MFAFICGEVCSNSGGSIVLKNNDIGYQIFVSAFTAAECGALGGKIQLFTYFHAGENGVALYGFKTAEEKELFTKLLTVSGVGAKLALTVLSGLRTEQLLNAIVRGDTGLLSTVKGVGKKTAERIVLELREKLARAELMQEGLAEPLSIAGAGGETADAAEALVLLGIPRAAAEKLCAEAVLEGAHKAEEIIKAALKKI